MDNGNTFSPSGSNHSQNNQRNLNSLTLPPLQRSNRSQDHDDFFRLPALESSHFLDAISSTSTSNSRDFPPPPSNQQASQLQRLPSFEEYFLNELEDDNSYSDLIFSRSPLAEEDEAQSRHTTSTTQIDLTSSSPPTTSLTMPATKKRKRGEALVPSSPNPQAALKRDSIEVVDLQGIEDNEDYETFRAKQQAEAIRKQNEDEANKPVKLAEFQCIICMDNPTNLTVTHCGHLFCAECLHSALHAGDKKCCPVCRATINTAPLNGRGKSKTGVYHLEMKLMTSKRKGKQPVTA